jgi:transcriptional regulator with XRE-family HTH domain
VLATHDSLAAAAPWALVRHEPPHGHAECDSELSRRGVADIRGSMPDRYTDRMAHRTRLPSEAATVLGRSVLATRRRIRWSQRRLADAAGVSQAAVWLLETGRADVLALGQVIAIVEAMGGEFQPAVRPPTIPEERRPLDDVHARLIAYVLRRFGGHGWLTAAEVEVHRGRLVGWIDVLAYRESDGACLAIEIKSELVDVGGALRQIAWYTKEAPAAARALGWRPRAIAGALLLLDSQRNHEIVRTHAGLLRATLPARAVELGAWITGEAGPPPPALATVDPRSRRAIWLGALLADRRRREPAYRDLVDFRSRTRQAA